ncbi:hypothetical protein V8G54_032020 [Vigna mungo]|uniref:Uncharacterized protein n=1 Tax=Vigna mungo TaxID=3915 RepID=A0AAQ3MKT5_VIGMU
MELSVEWLKVRYKLVCGAGNGPLSLVTGYLVFGGFEQCRFRKRLSWDGRELELPRPRGTRNQNLGETVYDETCVLPRLKKRKPALRYCWFHSVVFCMSFCDSNLLVIEGEHGIWDESNLAGFFFVIDWFCVLFHRPKVAGTMALGVEVDKVQTGKQRIEWPKNKLSSYWRGMGFVIRVEGMVDGHCSDKGLRAVEDWPKVDRLLCWNFALPVTPFLQNEALLPFLCGIGRQALAVIVIEMIMEGEDDGPDSFSSTLVYVPNPAHSPLPIRTTSAHTIVPAKTVSRKRKNKNSGASMETGLCVPKLGLWASVEIGLMGQCRNWASGASVETGLMGQCGNWAWWASVETGLMGQYGNWAWWASKLGLWANMEIGLGGPVVETGLMGQCGNWAWWASVETGLTGQAKFRGKMIGLYISSYVQVLNQSGKYSSGLMLRNLMTVSAWQQGIPVIVHFL